MDARRATNGAEAKEPRPRRSDVDSGRHIQAVFEAVEGGRKPRRWLPTARRWTNIHVSAPCAQSVLQGIRERNRREHVEDSIRLQNTPTSADASRVLPERHRAASSLAAFMGHRGRILANGCTPDGRVLVTTATDGTVRMAGLSEREVYGPRRVRTHRSVARQARS